MKNIFLSLACGSLIVLISSCGLVDSDGSGCNSCQDAIDHMAEKISDFSCNPYVMQNAWDGIKEDCGALADLYVGYMAENCNEDIDITPKCVDKGFVSSKGLELSYNYVGGIDAVQVIVKVAGRGLSETITIMSNESKEQLHTTLNVPEGEDVEIFVLDTSNDDELVFATNEFTFERDQIWWKTRSVNITYDIDEKKYAVNFEDW